MSHNNDVKIICEIASSHCGSENELSRLLNAALETGSDYIKFQVFSYKDLVHTKQVFPELETIELPLDVWDSAVDRCVKKMRVIIEPFDISCVKHFSNDPRVSAFKIPTADLCDPNFLGAIFDSGKDIFAGVGGGSIEEIDALIDFAREYQNKLALIYGYQSFPTEVSDSCLLKLIELKKRYNLPVGYADHVDASQNFLSYGVSAMAVATGASYIEKHFTISREEKKFDYYSALEPAEFNEFVDYIKIISSALGADYSLSKLNPAEADYRYKMKKFAVLTEGAKAGTSICKLKLRYCRTLKPGLTGYDVGLLRRSGAQLNSDLVSNSQLTLRDLNVS